MEQAITAPRSRGLNGFQLKVIALLIMTIDHIYYFFSTLTEMPIIMTLIGRIAAPVFVFMVAQGFAHTRNRGKYLLRLYACATLMQFGNLLINTYFPMQNGAIVINGIFSTMACIVFYLLCIEGVRSAVKAKKWGKLLLCLAGIILPILATPAIALLMMNAPSVGRIALLFLPLPVFVEGSFIFVIMGIGLYYARKSKLALSLFYTIFLAVLAVFQLSALQGDPAQFWLTIQVTVWMWLALPFMLLYNGEKGRGMKTLFYAYYPAHVYFLAILVSLLGTRA